MIGKPEWFKYRIFGWGIAPKTWQGYAYLGVVAFLIGLVTAISMSLSLKIWLYAIIMTLLMIDVIYIMTQLGNVHDERENYHQLLIERNCSFAAIATLAAIALYQTYQNKELMTPGKFMLPFDYSILIVIGVMLAVKIASTIHVKLKK